VNWNAADNRRENARGLAEERRVAGFPPRTSLGYNTTAHFSFRGDTMLKPQLTEFMRRMDQNSIAIIPAAREACARMIRTIVIAKTRDSYLTGFEQPARTPSSLISRKEVYPVCAAARSGARNMGWLPGRVEGAVRDYQADDLPDQRVR